MFGWMKCGRNNDNDGFSRTSRGNGVSAKGNQGEGDLLNKRGSESSSTQALNTNDDENEYKDEDEDDDFDLVNLVGHKKSMLGLVEKEDPKTSSVKDTRDANYLSQSIFDQHNISPLTLKATNTVGYECITILKGETLPSILRVRICWPRLKLAPARQ